MEVLSNRIYEHAIEPTWPTPSFRRIAKYSHGAPDTGNALIHGDNLEALQRLGTSPHRGRIRCVYMDPPYNNGESYTHYEDSMGHERWLESIKARLSLIPPLLRDDGSVWISIDDREVHYLKIAADSVFGRSNFVSTVVWQHRATRENRRVFSNNHEYILIYAKRARTFSATRNRLPATAELFKRYQNPDNDPRGPWQSVSANVQAGHATPNQFYTITAPNGTAHSPPKGRCWALPQKKMAEAIARGDVWFGRDGNGVPRLKRFLKESTTGLTPATLWLAEEVGTTLAAKKHLLSIFPDAEIFDTPKPERLLKRIIEIATDAGDLVLDPYLGSGTTAAVAHMMGRRYIGIEQGEHAVTHCAHRLSLCVKGVEGGISEEVQWKGGGGFDFLRLR